MRKFETKYEGPSWMPEKTAWDELPTSEKADIMRSCVRIGITSLQDIRTAYNNYAAGRNILEGIPDYSKKATEFGNYLAGGGIKYSRPYYFYDENGRKIDDTMNYNATLPEVVVIPDSRKSPAQRNEDERYRQRFLGDYAEQKNRDYTTRQQITAQRNWENSTEKKVLDFGIAAAQGIGMGADIVSTALGGLPVYSSLKGAQAFDRAISTGDIMDSVDAGLWLSPMLTVEGKRVYNAVKPAVQRVFQKGTPAAEWAETSSLSPIVSDDVAYTIGADAKHAVKKWINSRAERDRIKAAMKKNGENGSHADFEIAEMNSNLNDSHLSVKPQVYSDGKPVNGLTTKSRRAIDVELTTSRESPDDILFTGQHEYGHVTETDRVLDLLHKEWGDLDVNPRYYTEDGVVNPKLKTYWSSTEENRAMALGVQSDMYDRGFTSLGDYLEYLKNNKIFNGQWLRLKDLHGEEKARKIVESVFGLSPLIHFSTKE